MRQHRSRLGTFALLSLAAGLGAITVHAACNLIPSATQTFRGVLGVTNRPFAGPGEFVELRGGACTGPAPLFASADPDDYAVTLVFAPPDGGPRHVLVLATDCAGVADCGDAVDTECRPAGPTDLAIVVRDGEQRLQFRFPDTDDLADLLDDDADDDRTLSGPVRIAVTPRAGGAACGLVTGPCASQSDLTACVDELYQLDGSCRALVAGTFGHFTALPPPNRYEGVCTAPTFPDGPCVGDATEVRFTTDVAGNLLVPVDWQGILVRQSNVPVPRLLRAGSSIDALSVSTGPIEIPGQDFVASYTPEGALLPPIFLPQLDPLAQNEVTLFGSADAPHTVLRLARKSPLVRACAGGSEDGRPCTADAQCGGGTCVQAVCQGGPAVGQACDDDQFDCPSSECGPALFDFRDRYAAGRGPVVIPRFVLTGDQGVCEAGADEGAVCSDVTPCDGGADCVDYRIVADNPVPLEGLAGTADVFAFVVNEAIDGVDLSGDADDQDFLVLTLRDRTTGAPLFIGAGQAEGRPIVGIRQPPFVFPALASQGDVVAALEPEMRVTESDLNGDGDYADTILRIYRRDSPTVVTELTAVQPAPIAADATLAIDGRSLAVSDGRVFFRTPEAAGAAYTTKRLSVATGGGEASDHSFHAAMSADGRFVAFTSLAGDLVAPNDTNDVCQPDGGGEVPGSSPCNDVFVHDRDSDGDGEFDEPGATTTERVSVATGGAEGDGWSAFPSLSADGRLVAFATRAANFVGSPTYLGHVVRDRQSGTTTQVDLSTGGTPASDASGGYPTLSKNGRFVGFLSRALNLDGPNGDPNPSGPYFDDPNGFWGVDAYVRDRLAPLTEAVSLAPPPGDDTLSTGTVGAIGSNPIPVSDDGRWVAFVAEADNLVAGVTFGQPLYLRDRTSRTQTVVSRNVGGSPVTGLAPQLSADGQIVAFHSYDFLRFDPNQFCAGTGVGVGSSECVDVYVAEPQAGTTELVSKGPTGLPADGASGLPAMSADGRFVAFWSEATDLGTIDANGTADVYLRDRLTGMTTRISLTESGGEATGDSGWPSATTFGIASTMITAVSADGRQVAFVSYADDLVAGDTNGTADVFVRTPDLTDTASERTGDGDLDDTVLEAIAAADGSRTPLCPSGAAAVAGGKVAFLRPEASGTTTAGKLPLCPLGTAAPGGVRLDADGDVADEVVHVWTGAGMVQNLGLAATAVAISDTHVAAVGGTAQVHAIAGGGWTDTGQPAATIAFCGSVLAIVRADGELALHDPATAETARTGQQAADFVCNVDQVAFRTPEAEQAAFLNGDADQDDDVLQVWDLARAACLTAAPPADCLANSGYSVRPCRLEACDPRIPYRVGRDAVRFLTFECDEGGGVTNGCAGGGTDLNGNTPPYAGDLVIQSFNVRTRVTTPIGTVLPDDTQTPLPPDPPAPSDGSGEQTVFNSNGRCVEVTVGSCATNGDCANGGFCDAGVCKRDQGVCVSDADCPPGAVCTDDPIVAASPDTDADGVPDHLDNCPRAANAAQTDGDQDRVGDACDAFCTGGGDPGDKVKVKTLNGVGLLSGKLTIPLGVYGGESVTVRLDDTDSAPIAVASVATLPPSGTSGRKWLHRTQSDGLQKVLLVDLAPRRPGEFKIKVKAKRWFTAAEANRPAGETTVTVLVGDRCYSGTTTVKLD